MTEHEEKLSSRRTHAKFLEGFAYASGCAGTVEAGGGGGAAQLEPLGPHGDMRASGPAGQTTSRDPRGVARSRLYRSKILQVNMRLKALAEI